MARPKGVSVEEKILRNPKVNRKTGCIEWQLSVNVWGYGHVRDGKKFLGVHRVSFEMRYGGVPRGMSVLHRCDNPRCVNPEHLFLGTHVDNMRDMASKGRGRTQKLKRRPK